MSDFERLLQDLVSSGKIPPELVETMTRAINDPAMFDSMMEQLKTLAGPQLQASLNIEDYYQERDGRLFALRWPLASSNPLVTQGIPFESLDRKTQFYTLFADWSRREMEGNMATNNGDLSGAEATFRECLERADQIEVAELRARSYENMARVAERRSDQKAVLRFLDEAEKARANA
jgi:hypothetical protein